uniref:Uncharacterized protein n=1 Tax=Cacopsylla melanoneura TaxID=428564 RepID=A0A8D9DYT4_9HEMI
MSLVCLRSHWLRTVLMLVQKSSMSSVRETMSFSLGLLLSRSCFNTSSFLQLLIAALSTHQVLFQHLQFPTVLFHLYTFHSDLFFHSFDFLFNCVQVTNFLPNIVGHDFQFFVDFSSRIGESVDFQHGVLQFELRVDDVHFELTVLSLQPTNFVGNGGQFCEKENRDFINKLVWSQNFGK